MCDFKFPIAILKKIPHNRNGSEVKRVFVGDDTIRFYPYLQACRPQPLDTRKNLPVSCGTKKSKPQERECSQQQEHEDPRVTVAINRV